jgi:hypothetical protein
LLGVVFPLIVGCGPKTVGRSNLGTTIGDREVKASLDGSGFISRQGDAAVISFGGGKLLVDKASVQLDGNELAKLPEEAKQVEVDYTAGKLTITADGTEVSTTELGK